MGFRMFAKLTETCKFGFILLKSCRNPCFYITFLIYSHIPGGEGIPISCFPLPVFLFRVLPSLSSCSLFPPLCFTVLLFYCFTVFCFLLSCFPVSCFPLPVFLFPVFPFLFSCFVFSYPLSSCFLFCPPCFPISCFPLPVFLFRVFPYMFSCFLPPPPHCFPSACSFVSFFHVFFMRKTEVHYRNSAKLRILSFNLFKSL